MLWRFLHDIQVGDGVIARKGTSEIVGVGTVSKSAFHDMNLGQERVGPGHDNKPNFIGVAWQKTGRIMASSSLARTTVVEVDEARYASLAGM